jgi:hypothetical protein
MKNEDFAWLNEKKQDDEFAKDIISRLLHKITELERTVTTDVNGAVYTRPPANEGASDSRSNFDRASSVGSFSRLGTGALGKLKAMKGRKVRF